MCVCVPNVRIRVDEVQNKYNIISLETGVKGNNSVEMLAAKSATDDEDDDGDDDSQQCWEII